MGAILIFLVDFILGCILIVTVRAMIGRRVRSKSWLSLILLMVAGGCGGIWLGFNFTYNVSPTLKFHGFPMPVAFLNLESGSWVDYITPAPMATAFLNALFFVLLAPAPLAYYHWRHRRRFREGMCRSCGYNLTGNISGRCPECGTPITSDPTNSRPAEPEPTK